MALTVTQLRCKEVICLSDGRRLGFVSDVEVEIPEGMVCALIVPGPCRVLGLMGRKEDYRIPWSCIRRIGPDIILVDVQPEACGVPRHRENGFFSQK